MTFKELEIGKTFMFTDCPQHPVCKKISEKQAKVMILSSTWGSTNANFKVGQIIEIKTANWFNHEVDIIETQNHNMNFSNMLENVREEISRYFYLFQLKDRNGHLWDIKKVEIDEKYTILRLGNDGTDNYSACIISNCVCTNDDINELNDYEVVMK